MTQIKIARTSFLLQPKLVKFLKSKIIRIFPKKTIDHVYFQLFFIDF